MNEFTGVSTVDAPENWVNNDYQEKLAVLLHPSAQVYMTSCCQKGYKEFGAGVFLIDLGLIDKNLKIVRWLFLFSK
jgi:hypothetical protein